MELGFIQTAPASSPAPLANASTSADPFAQAGGAFDAALAKTLQTVEANAGGKGAPAKGAAAPHALQLTSLFMSSTLAAAPAAEAPAGEAAAATGESEGAVDTPAESEPGDESAAGTLVVAVPIAIDAPMPAVPANATAVQAPIVPNTAIDPNAGSAMAGNTDTVPAQQQNIRGQEPPVATPDGRAPQTPPAQASPAVSQPAATSPQPTANQVPTPDRSVTDGRESEAGKPGASATKPSGLEQHRVQARSELAGAASGFVDLTAQSVIAQNAAAAQAPATTTAPTIAAAIESVAPPAAGKAPESGRAESADSGVVPHADIAADGLSGNGGSMTGNDSAGGQSRPSPEFMRFAAALAQVTPATDEARGTTAVVAPTTSATTATASTAATAATAPAAPVATPETPGAENVGRLVQAMRVIARPGAWEATVRLNPEHLGDVSIALRVERNSVSAVVNAEAAGVRQWLESQEQAVRSGMAEHGLNLDRFIVQRDGQRRDAEAEQQQQESPRRQPRQRQATNQRFEIVV